MWCALSTLPRCLVENYDKFLIKYPLTREARRRIAGYCIEDILKDENFLNKVITFVENVLSKGKIDDIAESIVDAEEFLLTIYSSIVIISMLPHRVWVRFSDAVSKYVSNNLRKEVDRDCIIYVCRELGIPAIRTAEINNICDRLKYMFDVAVPVWDYVKYMPKNDPNWKLINRYVVRGYVLLYFNDLVRLAEEAVERRIIELLSSLRENVLISEKVREIIESRLAKLVRKFSQAGQTSLSVVQSGEGKFPPCIEAILNEIKSGGNPSHMARFTLAAFMLRALVEYHGKSIEEAVEEVVNLFKTVADFDERKTRYQVMHIAGLVGGRKFYMPPNCDELISLGLCPVNGACGVKNPLVAYARSLRKRVRSTSSNAQAQEHSQDKLEA